MTAKLKRREFITLLGSALATPSLLWPRASCAQQPGGMRRIGWLLTLPRDHPEGQARIATFHKGLVAAGWIEGHNLGSRIAGATGMPMGSAFLLPSWRG
jgi:hypothetical protein